MGKSGLGLEIWSLRLWGRTYRGVGGPEEIWYPLTLWALPEYNCILKAAVDLLLEGRHQLRVLHITGEDNAVADALSRGDYMRTLSLQPTLPFVLLNLTN